MSKPLWLDTHIHVSDLDHDGTPRPDFLQHLLAVLAVSEADLRMVISPDGPRMGRVGQSAQGVTEGNEFIRSLVHAAPDKLYGSCMVNPHFLDASLAAMDQAFGEWGFVQLGEFLQYAWNFEMNSPPAEKLVRRAVEFDVPVQIHLSTSNALTHNSTHGRAQLEDLCNLAERVPEAKYILAHAVGMLDDNPPVVDQYLAYVEGRFGRLPRNFWWEIRDFCSPGVRSVLARVDPDRLLAGTDWVTRVGPPFLPYGVVFNVQQAADNPYPPSITRLVQFLQEAGAEAETITAIASGNARQLLRITP